MTQQFMRLRDVRAATGLAPSTIYRLIRLKRFPPPIKILGPRTSRWASNEIGDWQAARIAERDGMAS